MATFRLRYENGRFVPLDPLPALQDGDEIEVEWSAVSGNPNIDAMLDSTRGLWAEWDGIEALIEDGRVNWDKAWREKNSSS